jgi:hypothetical protein
MLEVRQEPVNILCGVVRNDPGSLQIFVYVETEMLDNTSRSGIAVRTRPPSRCAGRRCRFDAVGDQAGVSRPPRRMRLGKQGLDKPEFFTARLLGGGGPRACRRAPGMLGGSRIRITPKGLTIGPNYRRVSPSSVLAGGFARRRDKGLRIPGSAAQKRDQDPLLTLSERSPTVWASK